VISPSIATNRATFDIVTVAHTPTLE